MLARGSANLKSSGSNVHWAKTALWFCAVKWLLLSTTFGQPARVVTRYALTSAQDYAGNDPSAWRLLGSNDGGQSWVLLDTRTNQQFLSRSQRRVFKLSNRAAFSTYRLQVDECWPTVTFFEASKSVQLAELELMGPLLGATNETQVRTLVSCSQGHPLVGPAENAMDNDPTTRWLDYGLAHTNGCWLQCQYAFESERFITNISQVQLWSRIAAAQDWLADKGPRILSNLTAKANCPVRRLAGYALTSANDAPSRDPRDWRLLGSNDGGRTWTVLDARTDELFAERFQRRVFALTNAAAFSLYRLEIDAVRLSNNIVQLAEVEPIYPAGTVSTNVSLLVLAQEDNPPMEAAQACFDSEPKTKWLSFWVPDKSHPTWIQWGYIPREPDLPIINQHELERLADQLRLARLSQRQRLIKPIKAYALTSANDEPVRDPSGWQLLGSNDEGKSWDVLDVRRHQQFTKRFQRRVFELPRIVAYNQFRLQIDSVADPPRANSVQLAEIEPVFADGQSKEPYSVLVSAQGDNPPRETIDRAFDANGHSKWLDYADATTNRGSWVEWEYVEREDRPVIDFDRLQASHPQAGQRTRLQLEAVVVDAAPEDGRIGLLDATGFQMFQLPTGLQNAIVSQRIRLSGNLQLGRGTPRVSEAKLEPLEELPLASSLQPGASLDSPVARGTVEGKVTAVAQDRLSTVLKLEVAGSSDIILARVLHPGDFRFPNALDCELEVAGVIEAGFNSAGQRVACALWTTNLDAVVLAPSEEEWRAWPRFSAESLCHSNAPAGQILRVFGTVLNQTPNQRLVLGQGDSQVVVYSRQMPAVSAGTALEVAGFLCLEEGKPVLRMARTHSGLKMDVMAAATTAAGSPTHDKTISGEDLVAQLQSNQKEDFHIKLRGVLTYIELGLDAFYLQDQQVGFHILGQYDAGLSPFLHQEGSYVEVEALVHEKEIYAANFVKVLGPGQMPSPSRHSWDCLMSGRDDGRWVQVEGVVHAVEKEKVILNVLGGQLVAWVNDLQAIEPEKLLGSQVRVSGVCSAILNSRNQRLGLRLLVPSGAYIEVLKAAPEDPFALPVLPIGRVMQAGPEAATQTFQIIKTRGTVTYSEPHLLFIQDGLDGMRVLPRQGVSARVGDVIEAAGMVELDGISLKLVQARVRKVGRAMLPEASRIDLLDNESVALDGSRDATRAQVEAVLLGSSSNGQVQTLELRHQASRRDFCAFVPVDETGGAPLPPGCRLRLEGVFRAKFDPVPDYGQAATSFEMYINSLKDITVLERPPWWSARHTAWVLGGLGSVLLLSLAWAALLRRQVRHRTRALNEKIEEHQRTETQLQAEIQERQRVQARMETTHQELVAASRQAGMAEIATGVLHNVGNVLNSVNVSTSMVQERLKKSRVANFTRTVQLLRQHEANLGSFLSEDAKGKQVLGYLGHLSGHLVSEREAALKELEELSHHIEHIKDIVIVQQTYARVSGVLQRVQLVQLVEDALRMNAVSLKRHRVSIVRQYASDLPEIDLDKHKVLQILINLISNAKYACDASALPDKQLLVSVARSAHAIYVSVQDNGVGISEQNLIRIFQHGFTTRKNGHGFGLHSGALAAKEMGGTLRAHSEGEGKGASFTLELPISPQARHQSRPA